MKTRCASRFRISGLALLLCLVTPAGAANLTTPPQEAWTVREDFGTPLLKHAAFSMQRTPDGRLVIAATRALTNGATAYALINYDQHGHRQWTANYTSASSTNNTVRRMAQDKDGNILLTGKSDTVKFSETGQELWTAPYGGRDLASDTNGNVYVTEFSDVDLSLVKLAPTGTNRWLKTLEGPLPGFPEFSQLTALGTDGLVYMAGNEVYFADGHGLTPYFRPAVWCFDSDARLVWYTPLPDGIWGTPTTAVKMAAAANGGVLLVLNRVGSDVDFRFRVYSLSGSGSFTQLYSLEPNGVALAVRFEGDGSVYMTGSSLCLFCPRDPLSDLFDLAYTTIKVRPGGQQAWLTNYAGPWASMNHPRGYSGASDQATALVVDSNGAVVVTGLSTGPDFRNDIATMAYDGATGAELWVRRYDGPAHGQDEGQAVVVDEAGNVYVAGQSENSVGGKDVILIKYAPVLPIQTTPAGDVNLQFTAPPDADVALQTSTNLSLWESLATVRSDSQGVARWTDTNAVNLAPQRFYRPLWP